MARIVKSLGKLAEQLLNRIPSLHAFEIREHIGRSPRAHDTLHFQVAAKLLGKLSVCGFWILIPKVRKLVIPISPGVMSAASIFSNVKQRLMTLYKVENTAFT